METIVSVFDQIDDGGKNKEKDMTSSTVSSLASPVDSGVQLLDSESEVTSVMSVSGFGCDIDAIIPSLDNDLVSNKINSSVVGTDDLKQVEKDEDDLSKKAETDWNLTVLKNKKEIREWESMIQKDGLSYDMEKEWNSMVDKDDQISNVQKEAEESNSQVGGIGKERKVIGNEREDEELEKLVKDLRNSCKQSDDGKERGHIMTKSDIDNQNIVQDYRNFSMSVPNHFDKLNLSPNFSSNIEKRTVKLDKSFSNEEVFEMEHPIQHIEKNQDGTDVMNLSLNSYELLDYTLQNTNLNVENEQMHVSLSEEVNENLKIHLQEVPIPENVPIIESEVKAMEEQIVFRRQRKKKSKSDTPKKRVSFHEDILNSTKIDDIHINHGFITHEPDVSLSFFQRGFIRKPDVVKGRYSWAAEGDAPYYEKSGPEREIKSDIYVQNSRFSSTSSSSGSISSSNDDGENTSTKKEPTQKLPKSSCLKKTKSTKKYIDTNIVHEETNWKRKSDNNILDGNIFGSLKNILNFSTSVPLAERGVPEGQEDITIYSSSHDISNWKRPNISLKNNLIEAVVVAEPPPVVNNIMAAKANLKLTKSEGFYPNYTNIHQNLPGNIILCDSNVYEHKGISYSYEYDNFQKTFDKQKPQKSSTVYQKILKEFNFFRNKAKDQEFEAEEDFEIINPTTSTPTKLSEIPATNSLSVEEVEESSEATPQQHSNGGVLNKYASSTKLDWSDNETVISSEYSVDQNPIDRHHLSSPKRKINKNNHYQIQSSPFKNSCNYESDSSRSLPLSMSRPSTSTSKASLINRFLRNVTLKKMLDIKLQNRERNSRKSIGLYINPLITRNKRIEQPDPLDQQLENEILKGKEKIKHLLNQEIDKKQLLQFRKEIFRSRLEKLLRVFPVRSAYTTNGDSKALVVVLSNSTLYIAGNKSASSSYCNHFVLPYTELNTILIGPNGQTIHFANYDKDMQCLISTGCGNITADLVGQIELAMRRDLNKPKLPAVKQLSMHDMLNLRRAICQQTSVHKDEEYYFYSIVNIQDFVEDAIEPTPLGPSKEGPLMFKTSDLESRWETAYFILKAGVLYMLSSASQRVPMRVFPLINGSCHGARRTFNCYRPHTFQLIIEGKSLHLAAPDEYVASEWLQELVHAASAIYNNKERTVTQSCSLLMTSEHILTVREAFPCTILSLLPKRNGHDPIKGAKVLSCASICDLTSFRLPSAEQSWCILEFECREVHECSGDWILYFASNSELEVFISTLEQLWAYNNEMGESFPLSTIPETDPLSKKCVDVYTSLVGNWATNTVHLQFL